MSTKIAFANTLKSVDDVRTFEKLAQTIAKANKYEVNIIGNKGKKESDHESIRFYQNPISRKSLLGRTIVRWKVLVQLLKINPNILIIGTHELLGVAMIIKALRGSSLIYDVRENYKKNIIHLTNLPFGIRQFIASLIRLKEVISRLYVDSYWLAESCYSDELNFVKKRNVTLENKTVIPAFFNAPKSNFSILFSGSISHYSQIRLAIKCYQNLKKKNAEIALRIIGQCHDQKLQTELENLTLNDRQIHLNISSYPISHQDILNEISVATLGLISYQEDEVNRDKIPTKLYEYSRHRLPFLIQENTKWAEKAKSLGGAIPIDFAAPDIAFIFDQVKKREDLFPQTYPTQSTWEAQESLILNSIENLIKQ